MDISMVLSGTAIRGKENCSLPEKIKNGRETLKTIQRIQQYFDKNFEEVGDRFSEVALRMQNGDEEPRNIKGVATEGEEDMLREKGVQYFKIIFPKYNG